MSKQATYDLREFQLRSMPLLRALHDVCQKHGLRYVIGGGTLLGAVREGGFIPWDDDMDAYMPRADYDRLMANADEWLPSPFHIVTYANDERYPKYFAKLEDCSTTLIENKALSYVGGIYMDVFPLDATPVNPLLHALHFYSFNLLRRLLYLVYRDPYKHGRGPASYVPRMVQSLFAKQTVHGWVQKVARQWNGTNLATDLTNYDNGLVTFPPSTASERIQLKFEDFMAYAPVDYDTILRRMYGNDYMTPPPPDKRRSHQHDFVDFDTPYNKYK